MLTVNEGPRLEVRRYRFLGATVFPARRLRQQFCDAVEKATAPPPLAVDPRAISGLGGQRDRAEDAAAAPAAP